MDACAGEMAQNNCRLAVDPQGGRLIYNMLAFDRREAKISQEVSAELHPDQASNTASHPLERYM